MDGIVLGSECFPQKIHVEILTPKAMELADGIFERGLGHEGRGLMNEMDALIRDPRELPCPFQPREVIAEWQPA